MRDAFLDFVELLREDAQAAFRHEQLCDFASGRVRLVKTPEPHPIISGGPDDDGEDSEDDSDRDW